MADGEMAAGKTLQERQVEALERIANVLELIDENFIERLGIPIAICTSNGNGDLFPIDVVVHKKSTKGKRS